MSCLILRSCEAWWRFRNFTAFYSDETGGFIGSGDGKTGIADLSDALRCPIFEPLKDKTQFSQFQVDKDLETIIWSNGADLAPEYIYFKAFKDVPDLQEQFKKWGYLT